MAEIYDGFSYRIFGEKSSEKMVIYVTGAGMENETKKIYDSLRNEIKDILILELSVSDWDRFLSPWKAEGIMKGRDFAGDGKITVSYLYREIFPYINKECPNVKKKYIAGYSLAGLFSLYALYETDFLDGACSCSGSLWYMGFYEYALSHDLPKDSKIYLSLGNKEPLTKNPVMKTVGEETERYNEILKRRNIDSTFIYNEGGHFTDPVKRVCDGIRWILE